jgi:hypothetical protein
MEWKSLHKADFLIPAKRRRVNGARLCFVMEAGLAAAEASAEQKQSALAKAARPRKRHNH